MRSVHKAEQTTFFCDCFVVRKLTRAPVPDEICIPINNHIYYKQNHPKIEAFPGIYLLRRRHREKMAPPW